MPIHYQPAATRQDLRRLFSSQARLLADRLDSGLGLDLRSLKNLLRVAFALVMTERQA